MNMQAFGEFIRWLQSEIQMAITTFKDKGGGRFSRPLLLGAVAIYGAYAALYLPPVKKSATLARRIKAAQATAQYAEQFKGLRDRLYQIQSQLPKQKDRGSWLTDTVVESMKGEGIIADSIMPPEESDLAEFYYQKLTVSAQLKFSQMVSLLNRIETTKPIVHVHTIDISKKEDQVGMNAVNFGVSTLIPSK